ncbi:MAG: hypothetical protein KIT84_14075 [Labilithrix sp.]|nr:hypothetical protein [Labilithrix sp.]MCW5812148.1 hypothetical protein [Labilithrix sp.]
MSVADTPLLGGRFELLRELGAGAFGRVFEARDTERGAVVALKRLVHVDADSLYRFKREFRAVAAVRRVRVRALRR